MAQVARWICHARARVNHLSPIVRHTPEIWSPNARTSAELHTPTIRTSHEARTDRLDKTKRLKNLSCIQNQQRLEEGRFDQSETFGEVAEWSNAPHSKCGMGATSSGVQIPPSPPAVLAHPLLAPLAALACSRHSWLVNRGTPCGSALMNCAFAPASLPRRGPMPIMKRARRTLSIMISSKSSGSNGAWLLAMKSMSKS